MSSQPTQWKDSVIRREWVDTHTLKVNVKNFRNHSPEQKTLMREVIEKHGWLESIKVNIHTNNLINGNMRLEIALEDGQLQVPVDYVDIPKEKEMEAMAYYDAINKWATYSLSRWEAALEEVGDVGELGERLFSDIETSARITLEEFREERLGSDYKFAGEGADEYGIQESGNVISLHPNPGQYSQLMAAYELMKEEYEGVSMSEVFIQLILERAEEVNGGEIKPKPKKSKKRNKKVEVEENGNDYPIFEED